MIGRDKPAYSPWPHSVRPRARLTRGSAPSTPGRSTLRRKSGGLSYGSRLDAAACGAPPPTTATITPTAPGWRVRIAPAGGRRGLTPPSDERPGTCFGSCGQRYRTLGVQGVAESLATTQCKTCMAWRGHRVKRPEPAWATSAFRKKHARQTQRVLLVTRNLASRFSLSLACCVLGRLPALHGS